MSIPEAALQQHIAVLGKTGSGKTYAAKAVIIEPMLAAGRRVAIVDPTGAWWGLRSSRDGKAGAFPILVLGGDHGDLPLPALGGGAVARLVEQGVSLVADTSQLTIGDRTQWFIDFASTLHRVNKSPMHLVLDEAHNFAPQGKIMDPAAGKMLHAANRLAAEGRSRGIRMVMITQRPQKLHKDALTSADTLIAMRVLAPQDRAAVEDWVKGCGDLAQGKEVLNSLASLQRGEGWVWYPEGAYLQRTKFPRIATFDSSATPTDGDAPVAPKSVAQVDLTEIREALADAVAEAEANDPKLLRAEIARLKREGEKALQPRVDKKAIEEAELKGYSQGGRDAIKVVRATIAPAVAALERLQGLLQFPEAFGREMLSQPQREESAPPAKIESTPGVAHREQLLVRPVGLTYPLATPRTPPSTGESSGGARRRIALALAQNPDGLSARKLAILADVKRGGSTWRAAMAALRRDVHLQDNGEFFRILPAGIKSLGTYDPLPTGRELREHWRSKMGAATRLAVFDVVLQAYPKTIAARDVALRADVELGGSTWRAHMAYLRGLDLINGREELRASEELFD